MGQGVIPDDWTGEYCRYVVCWPNSPQWLAVLRGVLIEPAVGRFWDENTGTITEAQAVIRETFDTNLHLGEVIMACNDENIANALLAIAAAIQPSGSTGGCGGCDFGDSSSIVNTQVVITLPNGMPWPVYGSEPIATVPPGDFPPGYEDIEEYDADKCAKASQMADDFISSLNRMGQFQNWAGVVGAGAIIACIVGLIVVPPAVIPLLLFALATNIGITAYVIALANYLEEHRDELVCILYEGETVDGIISSLADFLDIAIAAVDPPSALATVLLSIALWLMNGDTLNALFTSKAKENYPEADCSECGDCPRFTGDAASGSKNATVITDEGVNFVELSDGMYNDRDRWDIGVTINGTEYNVFCGPSREITDIEILTGSIVAGPDATGAGYYLYDHDGVSIYSNIAPPTFPICCSYIAMISGEAFTARIEVLDDC